MWQRSALSEILVVENGSLLCVLGKFILCSFIRAFMAHPLLLHQMPSVHLLLLSGLIIAASSPLPTDPSHSPAPPSSAAAYHLTDRSPAPPPSDPRVCLTNILMTYFRHTARCLQSRSSTHALAGISHVGSESDPKLLWTEPENPPSWWECGNCLEVICSDGLADLGMPLYLLPPLVYDRSVNGTQNTSSRIKNQ